MTNITEVKPLCQGELPENSTQAILAPGRSFLCEKNNTSSLFDLSASPFHGIRWDPRIRVHFRDLCVCSCVHIAVDLSWKNPFYFDDSSGLPRNSHVIYRSGSSARKDDADTRCSIDTRKMAALIRFGIRDHFSIRLL